MAASPLTRFLDYMRSRKAVAELASATDEQLLECFARQGMGGAFEALVRRHGPLVWTICRQVLRNEHDAEDAFQATFLVLVRKAPSIRKHTSLASWLHSVAYRIALKARATAQRQACLPLPNLPGAHGDDLDEASSQEVKAIVHEELMHLPERFRAPLILCYLEGRTNVEAARQLGIKDGTVASRLARARQRLRVRLARRGVLVAAGSLPLLEKPAAVAAAVIGATVRMAGLIAAGEASAATGVSISALALAEGFLHTALVAKLKVGVLLALILSTMATAVGLAAHKVLLVTRPAFSEPELRKPQAAKSVAPQAKSAPKKPPLDNDKDLSPPRELARMGPDRMRQVFSEMAFSPDGKTLVSADCQGLVRWWDVTTRKQIRETQVQAPERSGPGIPWTALAPNGKFLAMLTGGEHSGLIVFDADSGKEICKLPVKQPNGTLAFSSDSKLLAVAGGVGEAQVIRVWDVITAKERVTLPFTAKDYRVDFAFSHDGSFLVSRDSNGLHLWNAITAQEIRKVQVADSSDMAKSLAISPNDKVIASAVAGTITLWDAATLEKQAILKPTKFSNAVLQHQDLVFSLDGKWLILSGDGNRQLVVWDVLTKKEKSLTTPWLSTQLLFAPDGMILACSDTYGIHFWDVANERPVDQRPGHYQGVFGLAVSPDGKVLVSSAMGDRNLLLWDAITGKALRALQGHQHEIVNCFFSTDGNWVISSSRDNTVRLWDTATGKELRYFRAEDLKDNAANSTWGDIIMSAQLSRDGGYLFAISRHLSKPPNREEHCQISIWETATGKCLVRRPLRDGRTRLAPYGNGVFVANEEGGNFIEDPWTGRPLTPKIEAVLGVVSPDGSLVGHYYLKEIPKGFAYAVSLCEVASGKEVLCIESPPGDYFPTSLDGYTAFSPNGRSLAVVNGYGIHLWDVATGKQLFRRSWPAKCLAGLDGEVPMRSLCFVQNGRALATGMDDGTIYVWDLEPDTWPAPVKVQPLGLKEIEALWTDLAGDNAPKAHQAIYALVSSPADTISMLKDRLQPMAIADPKVIQRFLGDLDSEKFALRQTAAKELATLGEQIEPTLRKLLDGTPPLETRQRVEKVLLGFRTAPTPATLRTLRAIRVLEHIGTPAARQVLQQLAAGAPLARQTCEAKEALERLGQR